MRPLLFSFVLLGACASSPSYQCSSPEDSSGRGIALCHMAAQTPVCDSPGMTASYEDDSMGGYVLMGGVDAVCDDSNQVVCPDRTTLPHCIVQPIDP